VKRLSRAVVLMTVLSFMVTATAVAQEEAPPPEVANVEVVSFLRWLTADPINWAEGAIFFALGFIGALVTVYGLIQGKLPGIAAQAQIDLDRQRLNRYVERLDNLLNASPPDWQGVKEIQNTVNELRDDVDRLSRRMFFVGAILYVLIGGSLATILAQDMLQALIIGAGWTAFAGSLGLKTDSAERKSIKDGALERAGATVKNLKGDLEEINRQRAYGMDDSKLDRMEKELDSSLKDIHEAKAL
jgi:hypothetical protein